LNASTGVLSGTPLTTGTSNFTVTATDGHIASLTGSLGYTLTVSPAGSLTLSPAELPGATANIAYSATLTATGGSGTATFTFS
jgi:large repetitive protein